jgi:hypothetical protein
MKIDFSKPVPALDGGPRKDGEKPYLLRDACVLALDRADADDKRPDGDEKSKRGHLAMHIYGAKEPLHVTVEDVALIKRLVGKVFNSSILVAQIEDMLDPHEATPDPPVPTPLIPSGK